MKKYLVYAVIFFLIIVLIFPVLFFSSLLDIDIAFTRYKILSGTDYQKLLEAGRDILSKAQENMWNGMEKEI